MADLLIVMPVYNEQASVRKVVNEWTAEVEDWTEDFVLLAINDGSTDRTLEILESCKARVGDRLEILDQPNKGHGQSCLEGYRVACDRNFRYVLQIDSDGQCDPQYFYRLWRLRHKFDVTYGVRYRRLDGWRRVLASMVLRGVLLAFARVWCVDPNVPYRLMKTEGLRRVVDTIPDDFFLANVAMSVLLRRNRAWRHGSVPIVFRERYGGEPTVRLNKFGSRALELVRQLKRL
jgi:dolichol-phosphate mannosyltransferase